MDVEPQSKRKRQRVGSREERDKEEAGLLGGKEGSRNRQTGDNKVSSRRPALTKEGKDRNLTSDAIDRLIDRSTQFRFSTSYIDTRFEI